MDKSLSDQILETIKGANKILLHLHPSPDGDSVGSSLAMMHVLEGMGKQVVVISGDSEPAQVFSGLPGFEKIINQNYPELEKGEFDLFIIQDTSNSDQISKKGEVIFPEGMKTVIIDHHASNVGFGDINLIDSKAPAAAQVLYELIESWGIEINPDVAICLITGIYFDSLFRYPGTTSRTFEIAAKLSSIYPDFPSVLFQIENNSDPERVYLTGIAYSNIETHFGGKVAIAIVTQEQMKDKGILKKHIENNEVSNTLKTVKGWDIDISFIEVEPNQFSASFRTRDPERYDVSKVAVELGGGGHKAAAGARISKPLEEAKQILLDSLKKNYPDLASN
jgi:bifunctional oligoribonuclease and PAP phosphatase NrnA